MESDEVKSKRPDWKKTKDLRVIEKQYKQFFSPSHQVLFGSEGSLEQPSPFLNVWGVQSSDSGDTPSVEDSINDEGESYAELE